MDPPALLSHFDRAWEKPCCGVDKEDLSVRSGQIIRKKEAFFLISIGSKVCNPNLIFIKSRTQLISMPVFFIVSILVSYHPVRAQTDGIQSMIDDEYDGVKNGNRITFIV